MGISDRIRLARGSCADKDDEEAEDPGNPCTRCREFCKYFPIKDAVRHYFDDSLCLSITETYQILRAREGYQDAIDENNSDRWVSEISKCEWFYVPVARNEEFYERMDKLEAWPDVEDDPTVAVIYLFDG